MPRILIALVLAVALAPAAAAQDDTSRLATRGFALVQRDCGACHATGLKDQSPHRITPPFRILHERFPIPMLTDALKTGSIAGHDEMPGFDYGDDDIRAVLAYLDSLSPSGRRYLPGP